MPRERRGPRIPAVGTKAHPLLRRMFEVMVAHRVSVNELEAASGVNRVAIHRWANGGGPTLLNFEACLNSLGYRVSIERMTKRELVETLGEKRAQAILDTGMWKQGERACGFF